MAAQQQEQREHCRGLLAELLKLSSLRLDAKKSEVTGVALDQLDGLARLYTTYTETHRAVEAVWTEIATAESVGRLAAVIAQQVAVLEELRGTTLSKIATFTHCNRTMDALGRVAAAVSDFVAADGVAPFFEAHGAAFSASALGALPPFEVMQEAAPTPAKAPAAKAPAKASTKAAMRKKSSVSSLAAAPKAPATPVAPAAPAVPSGPPPPPTMQALRRLFENSADGFKNVVAVAKAVQHLTGSLKADAESVLAARIVTGEDGTLDKAAAVGLTARCDETRAETEKTLAVIPATAQALHTLAVVNGVKSTVRVLAAASKGMTLWLDIARRRRAVLEALEAAPNAKAVTAAYEAGEAALVNPRTAANNGELPASDLKGYTADLEAADAAIADAERALGTMVADARKRLPLLHTLPDPRVLGLMGAGPEECDAALLGSLFPSWASLVVEDVRCPTRSYIDLRVDTAELVARRARELSRQARQRVAPDSHAAAIIAAEAAQDASPAPALNDAAEPAVVAVRGHNGETLTLHTAVPQRGGVGAWLADVADCAAATLTVEMATVSTALLRQVRGSETLDVAALLPAGTVTQVGLGAIHAACTELIEAELLPDPAAPSVAPAGNISLPPIALGSLVADADLSLLNNSAMNMVSPGRSRPHTPALQAFGELSPLRPGTAPANAVTPARSFEAANAAADPHNESAARAAVLGNRPTSARPQSAHAASRLATLARAHTPVGPHGIGSPAAAPPPEPVPTSPAKRPASSGRPTSGGRPGSAKKGAVEAAAELPASPMRAARGGEAVSVTAAWEKPAAPTHTRMRDRRATATGAARVSQGLSKVLSQLHRMADKALGDFVRRAAVEAWLNVASRLLERWDALRDADATTQQAEWRREPRLYFHPRGRRVAEGGPAAFFTLEINGFQSPHGALFHGHAPALALSNGTLEAMVRVVAAAATSRMALAISPQPRSGKALTVHYLALLCGRHVAPVDFAAGPTAAMAALRSAFASGSWLLLRDVDDHPDTAAALAPLVTACLDELKAGGRRATALGPDGEQVVVPLRASVAFGPAASVVMATAKGLDVVAPALRARATVVHFPCAWPAVEGTVRARLYTGGCHDADALAATLVATARHACPLLPPAAQAVLGMNGLVETAAYVAELRVVANSTTEMHLLRRAVEEYLTPRVTVAAAACPEPTADYDAALVFARAVDAAFAGPARSTLASHQFAAAVEAAVRAAKPRPEQCTVSPLLLRRATQLHAWLVGAAQPRPVIVVGPRGSGKSVALQAVAAAAAQANDRPKIRTAAVHGRDAATIAADAEVNAATAQSPVWLHCVTPQEIAAAVAAVRAVAVDNAAAAAACRVVCELTSLDGVPGALVAKAHVMALQCTPDTVVDVFTEALMWHRAPPSITAHCEALANHHLHKALAFADTAACVASVWRRVHSAAALLASIVGQSASAAPAARPASGRPGAGHGRLGDGEADFAQQAFWFAITWGALVSPTDDWDDFVADAMADAHCDALPMPITELCLHPQNAANAAAATWDALPAVASVAKGGDNTAEAAPDTKLLGTTAAAKRAAHLSNLFLQSAGRVAVCGPPATGKSLLAEAVAKQRGYQVRPNYAARATAGDLGASLESPPSKGALFVVHDAAGLPTDDLEAVLAFTRGGNSETPAALLTATTGSPGIAAVHAVAPVVAMTEPSGSCFAIAAAAHCGLRMDSAGAAALLEAVEAFETGEAIAPGPDGAVHSVMSPRRRSRVRSTVPQAPPKPSCILRAAAALAVATVDKSPSPDDADFDRCCAMLRHVAVSALGGLTVPRAEKAQGTSPTEPVPVFSPARVSTPTPRPASPTDEEQVLFATPASPMAAGGAQFMPMSEAVAAAAGVFDGASGATAALVQSRSFLERCGHCAAALGAGTPVLLVGGAGNGQQALVHIVGDVLGLETAIFDPAVPGDIDAARDFGGLRFVPDATSASVAEWGRLLDVVANATSGQRLVLCLPALAATEGAALPDDVRASLLARCSLQFMEAPPALLPQDKLAGLSSGPTMADTLSASRLSDATDAAPTPTPAAAASTRKVAGKKPGAKKAAAPPKPVVEVDDGIDGRCPLSPMDSVDELERRWAALAPAERWAKYRQFAAARCEEARCRADSDIAATLAALRTAHRLVQDTSKKALILGPEAEYRPDPADLELRAFDGTLRFTDEATSLFLARAEAQADAARTPDEIAHAETALPTARALATCPLRMFARVVRDDTGALLEVQHCAVAFAGLGGVMGVYPPHVSGPNAGPTKARVENGRLRITCGNNVSELTLALDAATTAAAPFASESDPPPLRFVGDAVDGGQVTARVELVEAAAPARFTSCWLRYGDDREEPREEDAIVAAAPDPAALHIEEADASPANVDRAVAAVNGNAKRLITALELRLRQIAARCRGTETRAVAAIAAEVSVGAHGDARGKLREDLRAARNVAPGPEVVQGFATLVGDAAPCEADVARWVLQQQLDRPLPKGPVPAANAVAVRAFCANTLPSRPTIGVVYDPWSLLWPWIAAYASAGDEGARLSDFTPEHGCPTMPSDWERLGEITGATPTTGVVCVTGPELKEALRGATEAVAKDSIARVLFVCVGDAAPAMRDPTCFVIDATPTTSALATSIAAGKADDAAAKMAAKAKDTQTQALDLAVAAFDKGSDATTALYAFIAPLSEPVLQQLPVPAVCDAPASVAASYAACGEELKALIAADGTALNGARDSANQAQAALTGKAGKDEDAVAISTRLAALVVAAEQVLPAFGEYAVLSAEQLMAVAAAAQASPHATATPYLPPASSSAAAASPLQLVSRAFVDHIAHRLYLEDRHAFALAMLDACLSSRPAPAVTDKKGAAAAAAAPVETKPGEPVTGSTASDYAQLTALFATVDVAAQERYEAECYAVAEAEMQAAQAVAASTKKGRGAKAAAAPDMKLPLQCRPAAYDRTFTPTAWARLLCVQRRYAALGSLLETLHDHKQGPAREPKWREWMAAPHTALPGFEKDAAVDGHIKRCLARALLGDDHPRVNSPALREAFGAPEYDTNGPLSTGHGAAARALAVLDTTAAPGLPFVLFRDETLLPPPPATSAAAGAKEQAKRRKKSVLAEAAAAASAGTMSLKDMAAKLSPEVLSEAVAEEPDTQGSTAVSAMASTVAVAAAIRRDAGTEAPASPVRSAAGKTAAGKPPRTGTKSAAAAASPEKTPAAAPVVEKATVCTVVRAAEGSAAVADAVRDILATPAPTAADGSALPPRPMWLVVDLAHNTSRATLTAIAAEIRRLWPKTPAPAAVAAPTPNKADKKGEAPAVPPGFGRVVFTVDVPRHDPKARAMLAWLAHECECDVPGPVEGEVKRSGPAPCVCSTAAVGSATVAATMQHYYAHAVTPQLLQAAVSFGDAEAGGRGGRGVWGAVVFLTALVCACVRTRAAFGGRPEGFVDASALRGADIDAAAVITAALDAGRSNTGRNCVPWDALRSAVVLALAPALRDGCGRRVAAAYIDWLLHPAIAEDGAGVVPLPSQLSSFSAHVDACAALKQAESNLLGLHAAAGASLYAAGRVKARHMLTAFTTPDALCSAAVTAAKDVLAALPSWPAAFAAAVAHKAKAGGQATPMAVARETAAFDATVRVVAAQARLVASRVAPAADAGGRELNAALRALAMRRVPATWAVRLFPSLLDEPLDAWLAAVKRAALQLRSWAVDGCVRSATLGALQDPAGMVAALALDAAAPGEDTSSTGDVAPCFTLVPPGKRVAPGAIAITGVKLLGGSVSGGLLAEAEVAADAPDLNATTNGRPSSATSNTSRSAVPLNDTIVGPAAAGDEHDHGHSSFVTLELTFARPQSSAAAEISTPTAPAVSAVALSRKNCVTGHARPASSPLTFPRVGSAAPQRKGASFHGPAAVALPIRAVHGGAPTAWREDGCLVGTAAVPTARETADDSLWLLRGTTLALHP